MLSEFQRSVLLLIATETLSAQGGLGVRPSLVVSEIPNNSCHGSGSTHFTSSMRT